jgi:hypothetical protein
MYGALTWKVNMSRCQESISAMGGRNLAEKRDPPSTLMSLFRCCSALWLSVALRNTCRLGYTEAD